MPPPKIIIVLGPYRSGTSITSRVLQSLGVNFGPIESLIQADERNPSGYFELIEANEANTQFIESAGGTLEYPGDPEHLATTGDFAYLRSQNLTWMNNTHLAGIKDPRMCATLLSWLKGGLLNPAHIHIVHVTRKINSTVQSALRHSHVAAYAEGDPERVRAMCERYTELAFWHIENLSKPSFTLAYEDLVNDPKRSVTQLASFLGVNDRHAILLARAQIGKNRAHLALSIKRTIGRLRFNLGKYYHRLRTAFRVGA